MKPIRILITYLSKTWFNITIKFMHMSCLPRNVTRIQINHQPDATIFQFIILRFIYSSTCFGRFPSHHQELNDCSGSLCHHDTKVKPEAVTAVIELLMMDGKTPETCWAVNKRQDNKLENCWIWLVIYLNCTMMHGLTILKCYTNVVSSIAWFLLSTINNVKLMAKHMNFFVGRLEIRLLIR